MEWFVLPAHTCLPDINHGALVVVVLACSSPDPRFEGGGGSSKLNYDIFRKAYGFLGTYQDSEIEELKKSLIREKNQVQ